MEWSRTYDLGNMGSSDGRWVVAADDNGFALAGWTQIWGNTRGFLLRIDSQGNAIWNKTYGTNPSAFYSLIKTSDGGFAMVGHIDTDPYYDYWLVKTDSTGNAQWNQTFGGEDHSETAYSIVQTSDGGYAIAGVNSNAVTYSYDYWLVRTDSAGDMLWNRTYGDAATDLVTMVIQTIDGGFAMIGQSGYDSPTYSNYSALVIKTDSFGNQMWRKVFFENQSSGVSIVQTSDNGFAICGALYNFTDGHFDYTPFLAKLDSSGEMLWNVTNTWLDGSGASSVIQTDDGGYLLSLTPISSGHVMLIKVSASAEIVWLEEIIGGEGGPGVAECLIETGDGGYAFSGRSNSVAWLVKIRPGAVIPEMSSAAMLTIISILTLILILTSKRKKYLLP